MVEIAGQRGAKVTILDTRVICGLGPKNEKSAEAEPRLAKGSRKKKR